jgi:hypothetical protein
MYTRWQYCDSSVPLALAPRGRLPSSQIEDVLITLYIYSPHIIIIYQVVQCFHTFLRQFRNYVIFLLIYIYINT